MPRHVACRHVNPCGRNRQGLILQRAGGLPRPERSFIPLHGRRFWAPSPPVGPPESLTRRLRNQATGRKHPTRRLSHGSPFQPQSFRAGGSNFDAQLAMNHPTPARKQMIWAVRGTDWSARHAPQRSEGGRASWPDRNNLRRFWRLASYNVGRTGQCPKRQRLELPALVKMIVETICHSTALLSVALCEGRRGVLFAHGYRSQKQSQKTYRHNGRPTGAAVQPRAFICFDAE